MQEERGEVSNSAHQLSCPSFPGWARKKGIESALGIPGVPYPQIQANSNGKYSRKKFPGSSKNQNLHLLGWVRKIPLEKEMATHSSILAWEIPWTEEPGGLQSMGMQRVGHNWTTEHRNYLQSIYIENRGRVLGVGQEAQNLKTHQGRAVESLGLVTQLCQTLRPYGLWPTRLLMSMGSPRQEYWVGCHFLLQSIFPTQGLNLGLLYCRQILYRLSHQRSPLVESIGYYLTSAGAIWLLSAHISTVIGRIMLSPTIATF